MNKVLAGTMFCARKRSPEPMAEAGDQASTPTADKVPAQIPALPPEEPKPEPVAEARAIGLLD